MAPKRKSQPGPLPQPTGPATAAENTTPCKSKGAPASGSAAATHAPTKSSTTEQPDAREQPKDAGKGPGPSTSAGNESEGGKSDLILLPEFDLIDCFPIRIPLTSSSGATGVAAASAAPGPTPTPNAAGRSSGGGAAANGSGARINTEKSNAEAAGSSSAAKADPSQSHSGAPSASCIIGRMTQELYWGVFRLPRLSRAQIAVWMTETLLPHPSAAAPHSTAIAATSVRPSDRPVEVTVHIMCLGRTPSRILRLNGTVEYLPHGVTTVLGLHDVVELLPGSCPLRLCHCPIGTPVPRSVSDVVDMVLAHHSAALQEQWSRELLAAATAAAATSPFAAGLTNALSSTQQLFPIVPRETPPPAGESQLPFKSQVGRKQQLASGLHLTAGSFSLPDFSQSSLLQLRTAAATGNGQPEKPRSYINDVGESPEGKAHPSHQQPQLHRKRQRENDDPVKEEKSNHAAAASNKDQATPTLRGVVNPDGHNGKGFGDHSSSDHDEGDEVRSEDSYGELELIAPSGNHTVRPLEKGVLKKAVVATEFRLEDALDQAEREHAHALVRAPAPLQAPTARGAPTLNLQRPLAPLPDQPSSDAISKLPMNHFSSHSTKDRFPTLGGGGYGNAAHSNAKGTNNNSNSSGTANSNQAKTLLHSSFALESQVVSYNNND